MVRDTSRWVKKCVACAKRKTSQPHQGLMHIRLYQKPWETIGIDLIGPFPETRVTKYKYAMTVVDFSTHFLVVVPIQNKSAQTVATALFTRVLGVHGCPLKLMSGQGTEFLNQINHLCKMLSVKKIYTSAYRPQANGATERVHRFLNDSVLMFVHKFSHEWDVWVYGAAFVHNTTPISGADGLTPVRLMYGQDAVMPTIPCLKYTIGSQKNLKEHMLTCSLSIQLTENINSYLDVGLSAYYKLIGWFGVWFVSCQ